MRRLICMAFLAVSLLSTDKTQAQSSMPFLEMIYGMDPLLFNGKRYTYFPPLSFRGTQFLYDKDTLSGSVVLRGKTYDRLKLKYDIYNQELILHYRDNNAVINQLVVSDAWLESFDLLDAHFVVELPEKQIYQVLGEGPIRIFYTWHKGLFLQNRLGVTNYSFTEPIRKMYLDDGDTRERFKNNKSFLSLFNNTFREDIRKYLRRNRINVRQADDRKMRGLLEFINELTG